MSDVLDCHRTTLIGLGRSSLSLSCLSLKRDRRAGFGVAEAGDAHPLSLMACSGLGPGYRTPERVLVFMDRNTVGPHFPCNALIGEARIEPQLLGKTVLGDPAVVPRLAPGPVCNAPHCRPGARRGRGGQKRKRLGPRRTVKVAAKSARTVLIHVEVEEGRWRLTRTRNS